jgi:AcrR family transcriptional regulator
MNGRSVNANPRKLPRQARAKATVDAVIAAAAHVLVEHGYEGATTARVAERAGVSVGSLYQYFPNKEALVAALIERHADNLVATVRRALEDRAHATLEGSVRAVIDATMVAHRIHPALNKILHEQVPRVGRLAKGMEMSREIRVAIERCLRAHASEISPECDPAVAAAVIEATLYAIAHKSVLERDSVLVGRVAAREALRLVMRYVSRHC